MDGSKTPDFAADAGRLLRECECDSLALLYKIAELAQCSHNLAVEQSVSATEIARGEAQLLSAVKMQAEVAETLTRLHAYYGSEGSSPFSAQTIGDASGGSK